MAPMSCDGWDDDEEVEMVPTNIVNSYCIVSDSESDEEAKENLFEDIDDEIKVTPKTKLNPKLVHIMKNLQASYNKDANKKG